MMTSHHGNSLPARTEPFLVRMEALIAEFEAERCQKLEAFRSDRDAIVKEAKDSHISEEAFKKLVRRRIRLREIANLAERLKDEDKRQYEELSGAFGGPMDDWLKREGE